MSNARVYRTEGLVLKAYDYGEADRILTLYTPHLGKIRATAKGVRRTKSRMSGHLDLFMRSNVLVARGRNLDIITQADGVESFREMREDLYLLSSAHYIAELLDNFAPEGLANEWLYALTAHALRQLSTAPNIELLLRSYELQILSLSGFRPQLHHCLRCNEIIQPVINRFSALMGGVLCEPCGRVDRAAPAISILALKLMRNLQTNERAVLGIGSLAPDVQQEVEIHLREYVSHRLERRPRSTRFLDRLRSEGIHP
jgi:DNA repair protein RecO (recombination protein O)